MSQLLRHRVLPLLLSAMVLTLSLAPPVQAGGAGQGGLCRRIHVFAGSAFSGFLIAQQLRNPEVDDRFTFTMVVSNQSQLPVDGAETQLFRATIAPAVFLQPGETLANLPEARIQELLVGGDLLAVSGLAPRCFESRGKHLFLVRGAVRLTQVVGISSPIVYETPDGKTIFRTAQVRGIVVPAQNLCPANPALGC